MVIEVKEEFDTTKGIPPVPRGMFMLSAHKPLPDPDIPGDERYGANVFKFAGFFRSPDEAARHAPSKGRCIIHDDRGIPVDAIKDGKVLEPCGY